MGSGDDDILRPASNRKDGERYMRSLNTEVGKVIATHEERSDRARALEL